MIEIKHRHRGVVLYSCTCETIAEAVTKAVKDGADLRYADLSYAILRYADLSYAILGYANLSHAILSHANLSHANLDGIVGYVNSHDVFFECVSREKVESFTGDQWSIIGQLSIHRWCWDDIRSTFGDSIVPIFDKLAQSGFGEWLNHYHPEKEE